MGQDMIDCSSGGLVSNARIPVGPGYQVEFAERIRGETGIPTVAVGMIAEPSQANEIISTGAADAVFLGREMLRQPHWPLRAAASLGAPAVWPLQYERAQPAR
jgi:2,4-dienoyl-CoA reductase-like NADH-dependent reductase (Old Yellow Enzyme family)